MIALPSCFELVRGFLPGLDPEVKAKDLDQQTIRIFGRDHLTPRLTRWYGERAYTYSGARNEPAPMPPWLETIRRAVEAASGARFNSALLNYYRDGKDSVSWHADDEKELGPEPTIASLSIGAARRFAIRARESKRPGEESCPKWRLDLRDGDLLIMRAESQRDYLHSVPKTAAAVGPRINLTFRTIY